MAGTPNERIRDTHMAIDYDAPIEYTAVLDESGDYGPGRGWYVLAQGDDEYVAFTGPTDYEQSKQDAIRIARALTETAR